METVGTLGRGVGNECRKSVPFGVHMDTQG